MYYLKAVFQLNEFTLKKFMAPAALQYVI